MTHAKDPKAASAVPVPSTLEPQRVRLIPGLRASVHTDSIFTPFTDWMSATDIERIPAAKPLEGKRDIFTVRVLPDESSSSS